MGIENKILFALEKAVEQHGSANALAKTLGVNVNLLTRWLKRERSPKLSSIGPILDQLGIDLSEPEDTTKKDLTKGICFVAPQQVNANDAHTPPPEDYIAVPLAAGEVAAGRGLLPEDTIRSWVLVWKNHDSVRFRTNLIAVEVGPGQTSMIPTLHPKDILLVDRGDFSNRFNPPGNIFLVREPDDSVAVKRVTVTPRKDDMMITYYSDNAVEHAPVSWSLEEDFGGEISRAIIGRIVWAWSDMSKK